MNKKEKDPRVGIVGGQAVLEGVMMKGPFKTVLAVRNEQTKEITVETVSEQQKKSKI